MDMNNWVEQFYKETEREDREEILENGLKEDGMTEENAFRQKLWDLRYIPAKKEKGEVDHFFKGILSLDTLARTKQGFFNKRMIAKEIETIRKSWGMDLAEEYGELGKRLHYEEMKQLARTYIMICQDDKNFSTMIMGIGKLNKDTLTDKIASKVYQLAYTVPKKHNCVEMMAPFTKAITEVYFEIYSRKAERKHLQARIDGEIIEGDDA